VIFRVNDIVSEGREIAFFAISWLKEVEEEEMGDENTTDLRYLVDLH
jgi:hypothetical protein